MSELMAEIGTEVKRFLNEDRNDVERRISRTAIFHAYGAEIEVEQSKFLSAEEAHYMQSGGLQALATPEWFNDVEWIQELGQSDFSNRRLYLHATYPMRYFEEQPISGSFHNEYWLDQYGSMDGFGSKDKINMWVLSFVAPDSRIITRLCHPEDPTAIDQYNARYQQYLRSLDEANPTISYYRGWDRAFSRDANKTDLLLGGLSLGGLGVNEVVKSGASATVDQTNKVYIILHYAPEQNGHIGRVIRIIDNQEAMTEPFWDDERIEEPASNELLTTALELVRNADAE